MSSFILSIPPNNIRVNKSRKMKWAWTSEMHKKNLQLENLGTDRVMLK
jgi:hypothetical protein